TSSLEADTPRFSYLNESVISIRFAKIQNYYILYDPLYTGSSYIPHITGSLQTDRLQCDHACVSDTRTFPNSMNQKVYVDGLYALSEDLPQRIRFLSLLWNAPL